jgi:outer membrane protein assembly factor BamD (BamD/ComL family)
MTRAIAAALLLVAVAGCAAGRPPAESRGDELDDVERALRQADAAAQFGAYGEATRLLHEALARSPRSGVLDRVLLRLARLHVDPANPALDYDRAARLLERLLREHPRSPHAAEARAWRELLEMHALRGQEVQRVRHDVQRVRQDLDRARQELDRRTRELESRTRELELLKTLDLEAEQRPRWP